MGGADHGKRKKGRNGERQEGGKREAELRRANDTLNHPFSWELIHLESPVLIPHGDNAVFKAWPLRDCTTSVPAHRWEASSV